MKKAIDKGRLDGFADAHLYELDPPLAYVDHDDTWQMVTKTARFVVVSAANVPLSGPETYIFAADATGNVTCWLELEGSERGVLSHADALANAGYAVEEGG